MRVETDTEAIEINDEFKDDEIGTRLTLWFSATEVDDERFVWLSKHNARLIRDHLTKVLGEDHD